MRKIIQTAFLLTLAAPITAQSLHDSLTVTGAMITVTQERMNKGMITNSLDALSGQAAGVQVQSGGNHSERCIRDIAVW